MLLVANSPNSSDSSSGVSPVGTPGGGSLPSAEVVEGGFIRVVPGLEAVNAAGGSLSVRVVSRSQTVLNSEIQKVFDLLELEEGEAPELIERVIALVREGGDVNYKCNKTGRSILMYAAGHDYNSFLRLTALGANLLELDNNLCNIAHHAAMLDSLNVYIWLKQHLAVLFNAFDASGNTPYHSAAYFGSRNILKHALDNEPCFQLLSSAEVDGFLPLYSAAASGDLGVFKLLVESGDAALLDAISGVAMKAIDIAALCGNKLICEYLAQRGYEYHPEHLENEFMELKRRAALGLHQSESVSVDSIQMPSADDFQSAVKAFKTRFFVKRIRDIFKPDTRLGSELIKVFFGDKIIQAYLLRERTLEAERLDALGIPVSESKYEDAVFKGLVEKGHFIFGRNGSLLLGQYLSGSALELKYAEAAFAWEQLQKEGVVPANVIVIGKALTIEDIGKVLTQNFDSFKEGLTHVIFPVEASGHAFAALTIIERSKDCLEVKAFVMIDPGADPASTARHELELNTVLGAMGPAPFFDASLGLQTADEDLNCVGYSFEFIEALANIYSSSGSAAWVESCSSDDMSEAVPVLRGLMARAMPQFYEPKIDDKSIYFEQRPWISGTGEADIRSYFMRKRFALGRELLAKAIASILFQDV